MDISIVRNSFQVGDKVEIRLDRGVRKYGVIAGIYDDFILVNHRRHRECYSFVDMWIGEIGVSIQQKPRKEVVWDEAYIRAKGQGKRIRRLCNQYLYRM